MVTGRYTLKNLQGIITLLEKTSQVHVWWRMDFPEMLKLKGQLRMSQKLRVKVIVEVTLRISLFRLTRLHKLKREKFTSSPIVFFDCDRLEFI